MRRILLSLSLLLLTLSPAVNAQTLSVPNTFTNGSVADADEVNANFDAVETAVNHNHSRITQLEQIVILLQTAVSDNDALITAAQSTADTAVTDAAAAQTTANTAATDATAAQGTADSAVTNAATAQATANTAVTDAAAAATAASNAQSSADAAQAAINSHISPGCTTNYALDASACPFPGSDLTGYNALSNCTDAPTDSLCEGDGECGTSNDLNNCVSGYDVYYKADSS